MSGFREQGIPVDEQQLEATQLVTMMRTNFKTCPFMLFLIFSFFILISLCDIIEDNESEDYDLIKASKRYSDRPTRLCGPALTDTVLFICEGIINKKKSDPYYQMKWYPDFDLESIEDSMDIRDISFPMIPKYKAKNAVRFYRQRRGGIVDECCQKGCTVSEVKSYCRPNRNNKNKNKNK